jgi:hypothetical protein
MCRCVRLVPIHNTFAGTCAIASEMLAFGGCKYRKQVLSWTILHAISLCIYQPLMFECFGGMVCLVETIRFSQPLWTLRMVGTLPVVPLVLEVRLFFFYFFF